VVLSHRGDAPPEARLMTFRRHVSDDSIELQLVATARVVPPDGHPYVVRLRHILGRSHRLKPLDASQAESEVRSALEHRDISVQTGLWGFE
jgi:hypothetical protein